MVAIAISEEQLSGPALGSFQLLPDWENRPLLWYKQAEGLMRAHNITETSYHLLLIRCTLSQTQQEMVAHLLEGDLPASKAYEQLKAELTCLHQKSAWARLGEVYAMLHIAGSKGPSCLQP